MERKTGVIIHVVAKKGYWFILSEGRRIFCHISNWSEIDAPSVGDRVSYELGPARQTNFQHQAVRVRPEPGPTAGVDALASPQTEVRE